ncbi:hypothetical protein CFC21_035949 [Triticum aestivum]|uniref:Uncharacterized protein n=3 Tax=Triticum TaxID=4564 RepID=A0A9R0RMD1_TRITD|nr:uncharacterized protein LOC119271772 [Triticum dicoccoides]XP_048568075.1 uncharacterized protein LOC125548541 [Triticum urartu]KAF7023442.1 hypothetical protein CFC21_035949 [Triticum aestivum]VAH63232.1 unnamed protein product [Triticum turgidum subsp. durum]
MGNAVPRSMRHEATPKARAAVASRSGARAAVPSGRAGTTARRHGGKVARAAEGRRAVKEKHGGGSGGNGSAVVMTVKVVVTRKEAEKLIARLEEQSARERKARIAELTGQLRSGDGGGGRSPATCGAARKPRLAVIQES